VSELKRADVYGVHWFRAILRKKGLPYEEVTDSDSLYESMLATIENDGGLARGTI
jgi:hypothetical protein